MFFQMHYTIQVNDHFCLKKNANQLHFKGKTLLEFVRCSINKELPPSMSSFYKSPDSMELKFVLSIIFTKIIVITVI